MLCSLYTFLVYYKAVRNVFGCWVRDHASKSPSWKKGTRDRVLRFIVDSWSNMLRYQRPLHPCISSHCENTAHGYINPPFASASKLAAVLNIAQRYRLGDTTKSSEPCLSSNMFAMRAQHGGRSDSSQRGRRSRSLSVSYLNFHFLYPTWTKCPACTAASSLCDWECYESNIWGQLTMV